MAAIAAVPVFMRNVLLTFKQGAGTLGEFQCHVSEARIQVTPGDVVTTKTLCANGSFSNAGTSEYALVLVGVQDWDTTAGSPGLAGYLWQNDGLVLDFVLNIHGEAAVASPAQPKFVGQVTAIAVDYGGVINEWAPLSVELPCVSKPVLTTA